MTAPSVLRTAGSPERPTFLELLVDLVYVFALTRISQRLIDDVTTQTRLPFAEIGKTLLLLLALWLTWLITVWSTSWLDPEVPVIRVVLLITMAGSMVMAVAAPRGFTDHALVFAAAYAGVQLTRVVYYGVATRRSGGAPSALRSLFWSGLAAPLWIVGALIPHESVRAALWACGLLVQYAAWATGYPVPWYGRDRIADQPVAAAHLAERYQQFLLIALGEVIFTIGVAFSGGAFLLPQTVGFALGLIGTVLFWQIYFQRAGRVLTEAIGAARRPSIIGFSAAYAHLPMIVGIVLAGVGYELIISAPFGASEPMWLLAILGGPAIFLAGRAVLEFQVFSRVSRSRWAGFAVLGALVPVLWRVPSLAAGGVATAVLLGVVLSDLRRARGRTPELPVPRL
ncbi:low temperature requirement protein A [Micromonospora krabiensis]|uniref:Low temperature requirement protein LtrA n=1 Tax=Micromonospora krabiensis TaxID=307121 RepID=A0A1C3N1A7_9ACTN|nr:low temperature requirement protein A [Micromonospora krabiensis]SBV26360.1 Low temperature requirement protein LtrA [Micromonospora krabiensis]